MYLTDTCVDYRKISECEEIEFEKSEIGDGFHCKLGNRHSVAYGKRYIFVKRLFRNYNTCGMCGGMPRHSFKPHRNIDKPAHFGV